MIWPFNKVRDYIWDGVVGWISYEGENPKTSLSDFEKLRYELRPGDVVLVEGRSNVSGIIKTITSSIWSHSILYLGRLHDIDDEDVRKRIQKYYSCAPDEQLIAESLLGQGTIVSPLHQYSDEHLRICRPRGLTRSDAQRVINYAVYQLGTDYNVRQLMDLARFLVPYWWIPKRWQSSLFEHNAGRPTKTVCSAMMAEAFASVQFPIRPLLHQNEDGEVKMFQRNTKLITPSDFDHSPYFDVIKYPLLDFDDLAVYRKLPWDRSGVHSGDVIDGVVLDKEALDLVNTGIDASSPAVPPEQEEPVVEDAPEEEMEPNGSDRNLKQQQNV